MRSLLSALAMLMLVPDAGAQARPTSSAARSVQLITMGEIGTAPRPSQAGEVSPAPSPAPALAAFRVHDLSRRWVEFEMASSLREPDEAIGPAEPEDALLSPFSSIEVPVWMRGGSLVLAAPAPYVPGCSRATYRPTGFLHADAEFRRASYYGAMSAIACEYGIPVGLFDAMIIRESRYRPDVYSPKNAFGLTQLMPGTAAGLGVNRHDITGNLRGGAKYLRQQLDRFGQYHLALAAYNAGPGRVRNGQVPRIEETQAYVENVLANWSRLSGLRNVSVGLQRGTQPAIGRVAAVATF